MRQVSWVNLLLGIWLAISPFVLHVGGILRENNVVFGILAAIVAIWALITPPHRHAAAWVSLLIAFWIFGSPWGLGIFADSVTYANNALCGSTMMIFAVARSLSTDRLPARSAV